MKYIHILLVFFAIIAAAYSDGFVQLAWDSEPGDVDKIKKLIATGKYNDRLNTALGVAAGSSSLEMVKTLVEAGADNLDGALLAAAGGHTTNPGEKPVRFAIVRYLIEKGADINSMNSMGRPALFMATDKALNQTANWLYDHGADAHTSHDPRGSYDAILWEAVIHSNGDLALKLLKDGATPDIINRPNRQYPDPMLTMAAIMGLTDVVEGMLSIGADVDITNQFGFTPLFLTPEAFSNRVEIADVLVAYGADITKQDRFGRDVFQRSAKTRKFFERCKKEGRGTEDAYQMQIAMADALDDHLRIYKQILDTGGDPAKAAKRFVAERKRIKPEVKQKKSSGLRDSPPNIGSGVSGSTSKTLRKAVEKEEHDGVSYSGDVSNEKSYNTLFWLLGAGCMIVLALITLIILRRRH